MKHSFVILLEYVTEMIQTLEELNLKVIENESDLNLGYFTVEGETESIQNLKAFLKGEYVI